MSIVGVICLGILLEIVLPEGQTAKYVKGAFSLLVVFVIAMPLPNLLGKDWKLEFDGSAFEVDKDFIDSTHAMYSESVAGTVKKYLAENGYQCDVEVVSKEGAPALIERIEVCVRNFKESVAPTVITEVKTLVADKIKCSQSRVIVTVSTSS